MLRSAQHDRIDLLSIPNSLFRRGSKEVGVLRSKRVRKQLANVISFSFIEDLVEARDRFVVGLDHSFRPRRV